MKKNGLNLLLGCLVFFNVQNSIAQDKVRNGEQVQILSSKLEQLEKQINETPESREREEVKMQYLKLKEQVDLLKNGKLTDGQEQKLMNEQLSPQQYDNWKIQKSRSR